MNIKKFVLLQKNEDIRYCINNIDSLFYKRDNIICKFNILTIASMDNRTNELDSVINETKIELLKVEQDMGENIVKLLNIYESKKDYLCSLKDNISKYNKNQRESLKKLKKYISCLQKIIDNINKSFTINSNDCLELDTRLKYTISPYIIESNDILYGEKFSIQKIIRILHENSSNVFIGLFLSAAIIFYILIAVYICFQ